MRALFVAQLGETGCSVALPDRLRHKKGCVPHPFASLRQSIRLGEAVDRSVAKQYVLARDSAGAPFNRFYEKFRDDPCWQTHVLPCGHDVLAECPAELSRILLSAA
jgi:hypothetical protein